MSGNETDPNLDEVTIVMIIFFIYPPSKRQKKKKSLFYQLYTVYVLNETILLNSKNAYNITLSAFESAIFASQGFPRGTEWIINPWLAKV